MQYNIGDIVYYSRDRDIGTRPPLMVVGLPPEGKQYPYIVKFLDDFDDQLLLHEYEMSKVGSYAV